LKEPRSLSNQSDSVKYLPLAEGVVITFISPILTAWACSVFLHTPFTKSQLLAGIFSFVGVIMIARPHSLFGSTSKEDAEASNTLQQVTALQRLSAVILGLIANAGAACVYTTIRVIGDRAHPLISVNYYAVFSTVVSFFTLLWLPSVSFELPRDAREWFLLISLGVYGFLLQYLMTKGLQLDKTSRATNMMYAQIVFAVGLDWAVWGVLPGAWSYAGGAVVITSTIWAAMQKVPEESVKLGKTGGDVEYGLLEDRESLELDDLDSSVSSSK
jgi:drug/metabolite transporter (DMT)-like permease